MIVDAEEDGGETAAELLEMEQLQKRRLELIQWQTEQQRDGEGADVGETVDSDESESYFFKTALKVVRQSTSMGESRFNDMFVSV